ncbi:MAG: aminopeptidase P family N-terminal domain-containing protein, partial [Chloroflexi bacterium]|nr:aminopeptidase P family N-terminal domain-containing protein [Chloroflexota bacterium]
MTGRADADQGPAAAMPVARHAERLARARALAAEQGLDGVLIGVGADLRYLTGYDALNLERLTLLVVPADGRPALVVPRLEAAGAAAAPAVAGGEVRLETWEETDDPLARVRELVGEQAGRLAVSDRLAAAFVLGLQGVLPGATWSLASTVVGPLRIVKDEDEIALLERAARAADQVIHEIANGRLV